MTIKRSPYIDLHTHRRHSAAETFELWNIVVGRDDAVTVLPYSAGIHPWYIAGDSSEQWQDLAHLLARDQALAVGECGLDKVCDTEWELQKRVFDQQIELANRLAKPLIIHCVRAYQECLQALKAATSPVVFHGFNKSIELARQILRHGHYLSLGPEVLRGRLDQHIRELPLDRIFLETDGKAISIVDIYTYFCTVRKIPMDELRIQLARNFEQLFAYEFLSK